MRVLYGRWLIEGNPQVILLDINPSRHMLGQWKGDLFQAAQISIPDSDAECADTILFGGLTAAFLGEFVYQIKAAKQVVAHFHEWMTGSALPLMKARNIQIATVFTTHATLLGRFLCAGQTDFYNNLPYFDVDKEAGQRGIYHRHCLERAAAHSAQVFSTVSEITADESEHLLKIKAEIVLPNGLLVEDNMHEFQILHVEAKQKINQFVLGHFSGHYDFDIDKTVYFFTAGRYEFLNKGVDVFLESLARLNYKLKQARSDVTVVAFLIFPTTHSNYNTATLHGQGVGNQLRDAVEGLKSKISERMMHKVLAGEMPNTTSLLDAAELVQLKRSIFAAQRTDLPPVVTHNLTDPADPITSALRRLNLVNDRTDRVKVIFHPQFLNKANPLFPMEYEEFVRGCHLGVFPSYYEPWGYTPAECTIMGIPSITTNLSGFGRFIEALRPQLNPHFEKKGVQTGVYVADRRFKSLDESIEQLACMMQDFTKLDRRERITQRNVLKDSVAQYLDWKELAKYYTKARVMALERTYGK
eukprot:c7535_g1_i1.p1 GENE.c7535_g1_i1~~c7535_g1_i1.p1  ORF type:complete len:620 (+),score=153.73 c7535_g1_i1:278-1861(+)